MTRAFAAAILASLLLAGCGKPADDGPVRVSVIGGQPTLSDPSKRPPGPADRVLLGATAEGLVAFDEAGQVEPALAQRWVLTDDGLSYIFRLRRVRWPGGAQITASDVARKLRAMIAKGSRNPLRDGFEAIDEIVVITPDVLEVRLKTARPPLLELLAAPEAALLDKGAGAGPFEIMRRSKGFTSLSPRPDGVGQTPAPGPEQTVELRGERAAMAIARFVEGDTDLVLGGTLADLPIAQAGRPRPRTLRFDPAEGLFGLQVIRTEGFLADIENRAALAMAIDREAIVAAFGVAAWQPAVAVLPQRFRSSADPATPGWTGVPIGDRRLAARSRVAAWQALNQEPMQVRVALPEGPGNRLLFALIAADWRRIGVEAMRAPPKEADLQLIDAVAPAGSAIWYLNRLTCPTAARCDPQMTAALDLARASASLEERGTHLAAADRALVDAATYIPLARPLRWSLVSPRLARFRETPRAIHPLDRLRGSSR